MTALQVPFMVSGSYASSRPTYSGEGGKVYVSQDGGKTVHPANSGLPPSNWPLSLSANPKSARALLLSKNGEVYTSGLATPSWNLAGRIAQGQSAGLYSDIVADDRVQNRIFAVFDNSRTGKTPRLYMSTDGGASWQNISDEVTPRTNVFDIEKSENGDILLGTSHGVFQLVEEP